MSEDTQDISACLKMSLQQACDLAADWLGLAIPNATRMDGYDDLNFHVQTDHDQVGYTLKVLNAEESRRPILVEAHNTVLHTLKAAGICVPVPVCNTEGKEWIGVDLSSYPHTDLSSHHVVRLLKFVPGQLLNSVPLTPALLRELGETAANISQALQSFDHAGLSGHDSPWFLHNAANMLAHAHLLKTPADRQLVTEVLNRFRTHALPALSSLPQGVVHGDLNEQNVLVSRASDDEWRICGVLDVGDCHRSALLVEVAIAATYMCIFSADGDESEAAQRRVEAIGHVVAGYQQKRHLSAEELDLLQLCISARIAQSLLGGAYAHSRCPDNAYVLSTAKQGWPALRQIWRQPHEKLVNRWRCM